MSCGFTFDLHKYLDILDAAGIDAEIVSNRILIRKHLPNEILPLLPLDPNNAIILTQEYESTELHLIPGHSGKVAIGLSWGKIDKIASNILAVQELARFISECSVQYDDIHRIIFKGSIAYILRDRFGYGWLRNNIKFGPSLHLEEYDGKPVIRVNKSETSQLLKEE